MPTRSISHFLTDSRVRTLFTLSGLLHLIDANYFSGTYTIGASLGGTKCVTVSFSSTVVQVFSYGFITIASGSIRIGQTGYGCTCATTLASVSVCTFCIAPLSRIIMFPFSAYLLCLLCFVAN